VLTGWVFETDLWVDLLAICGACDAAGMHLVCPPAADAVVVATGRQACVLMVRGVGGQLICSDCWTGGFLIS
jgi:hypothetical protein